MIATALFSLGNNRPKKKSSLDSTKLGYKFKWSFASYKTYITVAALTLRLEYHIEGNISMQKIFSNFIHFSTLLNIQKITVNFYLYVFELTHNIDLVFIILYFGNQQLRINKSFL